jgi:hypothetical protein
MFFGEQEVPPMKFALATLIGAVASLAACADYPMQRAATGQAVAAAASVPEKCFRTTDIRNHTIADDHTLLINVNDRDYYRIEMSGACLAGAFSSDPLLIKHVGGVEYICNPIDLDISILKGGMASPCIVKSIVPLTPAEVKALPPKLKP